jgi:hypothetical protein
MTILPLQSLFITIMFFFLLYIYFLDDCKSCFLKYFLFEIILKNIFDINTSKLFINTKNINLKLKKFIFDIITSK